MDKEAYLSEMVGHWAQANPNRVAVIYEERRMSYASLQKSIESFKDAFSKEGLQRGDAVMSVMGSEPEFIAVFFALLQMDCVLAPCDTAIDGQTFADRLKILNAKLVIGRCPLSYPTKRKKRDVEGIALWEIGEIENPAKGIGTQKQEGTVRQASCMVSEGKTFLVAFTSGSTGLPKGVELTFPNLMCSAISIAERLDLEEGDRIFAPMPLSHMFGLLAGMLCALVVGACLVTVSKWEPYRALRILDEEKITVHHGVPTMFFKELSAYQASEIKPNLTRLNRGIAAGAFVSCNLVDLAQKYFDMSLVSAYGSTESVSVAMTSPHDPLEIRKETIGKKFKGVEVRIVDSDHRSLPLESIGELAVRGCSVMKGYLNLPEETARVLDADGWLYTGDLMMLDKSGYLRILGRKKDIIIRGGNNVAPAAIECICLNNPKVEEVAVVGYPDEVLGEKIVAFILPKEGTNVSEEELRRFIGSKTPKFSIPDVFLFCSSIPKLSNGKIDRRRLRDSLDKTADQGAGALSIGEARENHIMK